MKQCVEVSTRKRSQPTNIPFPTNPLLDQADWDIPAGTYDAICSDVSVLKNICRNKWKSKAVETVDLAAFLFELSMPNGTRMNIATRLMTVSFYEKSALSIFLGNWFEESPAGTFEPNSYLGAPATITVELTPGKKHPDMLFPRIAKIAPPNDDADTPVLPGGVAHGSI